MNGQETDTEAPVKPFPDEPLIRRLRGSIRHAARVLAVLMVLVIWWGVADVVYVLYSRVSVHPYYLLEISDISPQQLSPFAEPSEHPAGHRHTHAPLARRQRHGAEGEVEEGQVHDSDLAALPTTPPRPTASGSKTPPGTPMRCRARVEAVEQLRQHQHREGGGARRSRLCGPAPSQASTGSISPPGRNRSSVSRVSAAITTPASATPTPCWHR
jgi:hypothetical protein